MQYEEVLPEIARVIRSIRYRLKKNMTDFGGMIGMQNSTVSRYEAGKLEPSRSVLLLLMNYAQGNEKQVILDALNDPPTPTEGPVYELRKSLGLTHQEMADRLGISLTHLRSYELQKSMIPFEVAQRMQAMAAQAGLAEIALTLSSEAWQIQAVFHPGETFISQGREVPPPPHDDLHTLLDELIASVGEDTARSFLSSIKMMVNSMRAANRRVTKIKGV